MEMNSILLAMALILMGALIAILGGLCGAFLMWKGSRAVPGETFTGGVPKGEVFSINDMAEEEPDVARTVVMDRLNTFMNQFKGGDK
jgi:hypothetical protein